MVLTKLAMVSLLDPWHYWITNKNTTIIPRKSICYIYRYGSFIKKYNIKITHFNSKFTDTCAMHLKHIVKITSPVGFCALTLSFPDFSVIN